MRVSYCPAADHPCLASCDPPCAPLKKHDPTHPYVRRLVGCGHGVLFKDPCPDCDRVGLHEKAKWASESLARATANLSKINKKAQP